VQLDPEDLVILYTDGITDATDNQERAFGTERLRQRLVQERDTPVADLIASIEGALRAHVGDMAPFDDITMMVVRRRAQE
jgi:sigma-B regulation protein RsbU (phosphoserine phosphatase)